MDISKNTDTVASCHRTTDKRHRPMAVGSRAVCPARCVLLCQFDTLSQFDTDKTIENMAPNFDLVVINATVVTASDIGYRASDDSIDVRSLTQ